MTTDHKFHTINSGLRPDGRKMEKRFWRNWFFLAAVLFIAIAGLTTAIPPLLTGRISSPWPWMKTDLVLIVGLSMVVLAFILYLTQQQRQVEKMRKVFQKMMEDQNRQVKKDNSRLRALLSVSQKMSMETDAKRIFDAITDACLDTFDCQRSSLMLVDKDSGELIIDSVSGETEKEIMNKRIRIGEGIAGWAAKNKEPVLISNSDDFKKYPELEFNNPTVLSAMIVPIILRDEVIGVLNISSKSENTSFNEEDLNILQVFAENVGVCIRHKEQTDWLKSMIESISSRRSEVLEWDINGQQI
mgnify:CR=1 FL=1